jgi:flagellin
MSLRINHNLASINGHRNMVKNDMALSRSLEKLSSGLKINRAADDAAGLIISEQMRAQIAGLNQAVDNTETAVAMVQTAEGALDEMNTLLNKGRELALHAANAGANDTNQLVADQTELDNIINSITRIAENTQFGTKRILDGTLSNAQVLNPAAVAQFSQTGLTNGNIAVNVTVAGVRAASTATALSNAEAVALTNASAGNTLTDTSTFDNQTTLSIVNRDGTNRATATVAAGTSVRDALALLNAEDSGVTTAVSSAGAFSLAASDFGTYANGSRLVIQGGATTANVGYDIAAGVLTGVMTGGVNVEINRASDGTAATVAGSALSNAASTNIFKADAAAGGVANSAATGAHAFLAATTLSLIDASGNVLASIVAPADATPGAAGGVADATFAEALSALSAASNGKFTVTAPAAGQVTITATHRDAASNGVYLSIAAGANSTVSGPTAGGIDDTSTGFGSVGLTVDGDRGTTFSGANSGNTQTVNLSLATGVGGTVSSYSNALKVTDGAVFQIGANRDMTVAVSIASAKATDLGLGVVTGASLDTLRTGAYLTGGRAQEAISIIDDAIDEVTVLRGKLGAVQSNTLESNLSNLRATLENTTSAESVIRDVDFAAESAVFTKNNILVQASTAMLAQANQLPQNVLKLLG